MRVFSASFLERRAESAEGRLWDLREEVTVVWRVEMRVERVAHWVVRLEIRVLREAMVVSWGVMGDGRGEEGGLNLMVWEVLVGGGLMV